MKKIIATLLVSMLVLSLMAGCGKSDTTKKSAAEAGTTEKAAERPSGLSDKTITVAIPEEPNHIIPGVLFEANTLKAVTRCIYEPMISSTYETLIPEEDALVTEIEQIDNTHVRLTLREGVIFQNGETMTTADIQYMFEQGLLGAHANDKFQFFAPDQFVIEDDYHIIIALSRPWAQAMEMLSFGNFMVTSKSALEAAGGATTKAQYIENAGTGKYRFKEWAPGEYIMLERNEDYWNKDNMGYYAGIKFVFITDANARALAAQSGDVDIAVEAPLSNYTVYEADSNIKVNTLADNKVNVLFLNSGMGGPCEDVRVREAIYWLLDKEALRQVAGSGLGDICETIIHPKGPMSDGIPVADKPVDVKKAKALLAEAGYADGLTLRFRHYEENPVLPMIQEQLRQGGIEVEIIITERPVHFPEGLGKGDFDIYWSAQQFAYYTEAVRCTDGITFGYGDVMGGCGYKNEAYSEVANRCYTTLDLTERKEAYAELQKLFRENFVSIGVYSNSTLVLSRPEIEGITLFDVGATRLDNIYEK